ncbi:phosphate/phosphite/phosphonate ABC transporter substrate-binding protein [Nereida sp. MMG025]|uniref:phosphate/phosphite/phosphonate ABC transporter substrate-binding protein n=1 Tax=Nereida sp. MMG025 TaxID=2909981 RepID=UPI001F4672F6|nr:PhnD/SsuA/transferrin family substrate-binding protein [Nereida sp. MMG025]MCF6443835.1 PhnD/SsuA/transferrin family substrate-binding protein [Nereida sp. MMG025]
MLASLPMYDVPSAALADYWVRIEQNLGYGPQDLCHPTDLIGHWQDQDLLLSQTCALPLRTKLRDKVQLVGTPDYGLPDCPAGYYFSVIVTREGSSWGDRWAFNDALSQSGWAALCAYAAETSRPAPIQKLATGSHAASLEYVAQGKADVCAVDAITFGLLKTSGRLPACLQVIAQTTPTPGLPYITARDQDPNEIAAAIRAAIETAPATLRESLGIQQLVDIPIAAYFAQPIPPSP